MGSLVALLPRILPYRLRYAYDRSAIFDPLCVIRPFVLSFCEAKCL
jgi:hypothetical protein